MGIMNNFYVYGYIRLDTNTYFYIGKGHDNRYLRTDNRKPHFLNILNSVDVCVEILYYNLTEEESFELERETIEDLVFIEGYSIDIPNFQCTKSECNLVNLTWGGDGSCGYSVKQSQDTINKRVSKNLGKKRTKEQRNNISEGIRKSIINNPDKFKHFGNRKGSKLSEESKCKISNSNRGKKRSNEFKQKLLNAWLIKSEEERNEINKRRSNTCKCRSRERSPFEIVLKNLNDIEIYRSKTVSDLATFMFENGYANTYNGARASINECTKHNKLYRNQYKIIKEFTCND